MEGSQVSNPGYRSKRGRISRACDRCRARKVRCDDLQPTCSNCLRADVVCTTSSHHGDSSEPVTRRKTGPDRHPSYSSTVAQPGEAPALSKSLHQATGSRQGRKNMNQDMSVGPRQAYSNEGHDGARSASIALQMTPVSTHSDFHAFTSDMGAAVNVDHSTIRRQHMGSSSLQVLTQWLSITFAAYGMPQSFSSQFQDGMRPAVEMQLPMAIQLPSLPNPAEIEAIANIYLRKSGSIFPILQQEEVSNLITLLPRFLDLPNLDALYRPQLACLYAMLSIGYDEKADLPSDLGTSYLQAAYSMMSHILATPYLPSVQALLLITIALLGRNKGGNGWCTLGQAIRMSYALGLHRRDFVSTKSADPQKEPIRRIWWSTYCLERMVVAECGRPTMILDDQVDQDLPPTFPEHMKTLQYLGGLARIQGEISHRLYGTPNASHRPSSYFKNMAEIDEKLTRWLRSLPEQLRPDQEPLCCGPDLALFVTFLGFQYYHVLITLYRPALLFDEKIYEEQLASVDLEDSTYHRLRAGESICVKSARSIVTLLSDALQKRYAARLVTLTQPLLATYVLAIQLIKHPLAWTAASDLKLLARSSKEITDLFIASGQTPGFYGMLRDLQRLAEQSVRYATSSHAATPVRAASPGELTLGPNRDLAEGNVASHDFENRQIGDANGMSMANFDIYQSLPFFFDHDLQNDDLRAEDACYLFGLPMVGNDFGNLDDST